MPEKPEVITVAKTLEKKIIGKKITEAKVYYDNVIVGDKEEFISKIKDEKIESITTRGKWIIIYLTKIIHFFYQYHTIQSQNGQEKRKIRAKKIVYNVKKITKRKSTIC